MADVEANPFRDAADAGVGRNPFRDAPTIDFNRPIPDVRADIAKIPEGPQRDAALKQWADAYVAKEREGVKKLDVPGTVNPLRMGDVIRNVARGTLVGSFADELNAATAAGIHKVTGGKYGAPYDEAVAYQRALDRALHNESPIGSTVAELAGGVASGAPVANAVLGTGKTLLGKAVKGGAAGAAYGYVSGFGRGEGDLQARNEAGQEGAAIGAPLGAFLPVGTSLATYGANKLADAVVPQLTRWREGPSAAADVVLAQRMRNAGQSPLGVAADLAEGQAATRVGRNGSAAELPETIGDTSNAMQRLLGSVYRAGGEAGNTVKTTLDARQRGPRNPYAPQPGEPPGQAAQIMDAFDRSLGIKTAKSAYRTEQQVIADMKSEADALYGAARKNSEPFDLQPALDTMALKIQQYPPPFAAELSRALGLFVNPTQSGANAAIARITGGLESIASAPSEEAQKKALALVQSGFSSLQKLREKSNRPLAVDDIQRFDYAKRALDRMIEKAEPTMQRELVQFKNALLNEVHGVNPNGEPTRNLIYQKARDTYVEGNAQKDALDLGRRLARGNARLDEYRALPEEGQKRMARIGLREGIQERLAHMKPGDDASRMFQEKGMVDLLNEAIPGRTRPERFGEYMTRQQRMVQTRNTATGGSQTAERANDDLEFGASVMSQMWDRFKNAPSLKGALIESIGAGIQHAFAYRQDVARQLAQRLLETDPSRQAAVLAAVQRRMGPDRFAELADILDRHLYSISKVGTQQATTPR